MINWCQTILSYLIILIKTNVSFVHTYELDVDRQYFYGVKK